MSQEQDEQVIPLVEERVRLAKREIETGRVRVRTRVEERPQLIQEELATSEVEIRRYPREEELAAMPEVRQAGDTTIIPIVEEVLVIEKKLMLVEEIHLTRRRSTERFEEEVVLARQEAEIERD